MTYMKDYIEIDGIDVTNKRIMWEYESEWKYAIDSLTIDVGPSIYDVLPNLGPGSRIIVKRGFNTPTDEFIIDGDVTQVRPQVDRVSLVCKGRMNDAIKMARTKSWDKDIDVEQGIGSELFKALCDNSKLGYTPAKGDLVSTGSIPCTGTTTADKVVKFIQQDEDNFQLMDDLSELFERVIWYDYNTGLVHWEDKGFVEYAHPLVVGVDIQNQIKWKENMEQMINKVKVNGATVYDKINPPIFAGPSTTFDLEKTPEDSEVRQGSETGQLYIRGQKGIGTLGVNFDYYIDTTQKKITFAAPMSNIWVRYGAQVPMPIVISNPTSIVKYGGPNAVPFYKAFTYNDLKDVADAEDRARTIINKYSTPFYETREDVQINDPTIIDYGLIKPGYLVRVIDNFNEYDLKLFVKIVKKSFPHIGDRITIGDEIWRTEDWQAETSKRINLLFADLNKNQDLVITGIDNAKDITHEDRYTEIQRRTLIDKFVLGNPILGIYGVNLLGADSAVAQSVKMIPGQNEYKELVYDTLFYDSVTSTGVTWNIGAKTITITDVGYLYTLKFAYGQPFNYATINFADIGGDDLGISISTDDGTTWTPLIEGTKTAISPSTTGTKLKINAIAGMLFPITFPVSFGSGTTAVLKNTYDVDGSYILPAISLLLEE